jgi:hypothetical protein
VFIGITKIIQSAQKAIPFWIRLEQPKKRVNLLRHIFAPSPHVVLKFGVGAGEREVGVMRIDATRNFSDPKRA